ncbi:hypothetical protein B0A55_12933 [Friedmanniomyces simplex]|uniref:Uncharacterized protein n=1 Tax=Friedmanniomyces simplex TaxID=329884 RepID=A0A4U0VXH9_9PEZI|nr:hypothetical protein B0A55_12933 [Friedmanniomyces simplex]
MARLNTRSSHAPSSRFGSATPAPGNSSDQENQDPVATARDKGKGRAMLPPPPQHRTSLPTPTSDASDARGQKRKRVTLPPAATQETEDQVDEDYKKFHEFYDPNQDPDKRREQKRKSRALEREFQDNRDEILHGDGEGLVAVGERAWYT